MSEYRKFIIPQGVPIEVELDATLGVFEDPMVTLGQPDDEEGTLDFITIVGIEAIEEIGCQLGRFAALERQKRERASITTQE